MPELPEVEVVKQSLKKYILNQRILKIIVKNKKLRFKVPSNLSKKLSNLKILNINRVSKYLVIQFENNFFLLIHFGMSGTLHMVKSINDIENTNLSFYHSKKLPQKHNHIYFNLRKCSIIFNDPRRFGFIKLVNGKINLDNFFKKLGPDPFEKRFNFDYVKNFLNLVVIVVVVVVVVVLVVWSLGPGIWNLESGPWSLGSGAWSLEPGAWNLQPGVWSLEAGAWSLEAAIWSLEPGVCRQLQFSQ